MFDHLVARKRVAPVLAAQRARKEQPVVDHPAQPGASRGFVAGRLTHHKRLLRFALSITGLWSRGQRNARAIRIHRCDIAIPDLPQEFDGYVLLHLSDLHLDIADDITDVIASALTGLKYDACVITGDFRAATHGPWRPAIDEFARLNAHLKAPVYAVFGNHDSLYMLEPLEELGVKVLMNEHQIIKRGESSLTLIGVDDAHYFRTDNLNIALEGVPADATKILLSHTPELYAQAQSEGVHFMMAGHTHGGQICLPGGIPVIVNADCPRRFCRGQWHHETLSGYTSAGTGSSVIDVRLNCPPEAVLHRLVRA